MPLSNYDKQFGGESGSAAKAHRAMIEEYGEKKGEQVFYATKNKRQRKMKRGEFKKGGYDWRDYD